MGEIDAYKMTDDLEVNAEIYSSTYIVSKEEWDRKISDRIMGKEYKNVWVKIQEI